VSGIRLAVLDDNPYVAWGDRVHPVSSTFDIFLAALLDVPGDQIEEIILCAPVRPAGGPPTRPPIDGRLRIVATTPFDGIAGYLRSMPSILRRNAPILRNAFSGADLVWIRVPSSNAPLAAWLARAGHLPRFGFVTGSARSVAASQRRGPLNRAAAVAVGAIYDGIGGLAGGRHRIVVGRDIVSGRGIVSSLIEDREILEPGARGWPTSADRIELVWSGRVAPGKGLELVVEALPHLPTATLSVLGEGPQRPALMAAAKRLGVDARITWHGHVADRERYMAVLAAADVFVLSSGSEGFPKVVLDAMAVGLPVVARPVGTLAELATVGLIVPIHTNAPSELADAVRRPFDGRVDSEALRVSGTAFARRHTRSAEAARLVDRLRTWFVDLPWGPP
jgi:glycosyltransferase involved in cell wall biosynthesis